LPAWLLREKERLERYFTGLNDPKTLIVPIERTRRLLDDPSEDVEWAAKLMAEAAAGKRQKRAPLSARFNQDGTYTILDGKSTHEHLEHLGLRAVPLVVVEHRRDLPVFPERARRDSNPQPPA
jgi:hypothetical protein